MKYILTLVILLSAIAGGGYVGNMNLGAAPYTFISSQVGGSPANGKVLQTNGSISTWVATSTLGISAGSAGSTFATTSISALFPIAWDTSTAQLSFNGIGTSSAPTIGNLSYWTGVNRLGSVATSTATCSSPLSCTAFNVVGAGSTLSLGTVGVANGGTGAITFGQGWLHSAGGTSILTASTSPTVNYITATSTTATSTFANGIRLTGGCFLTATGGCAELGSPTTTPTTRAFATNFTPSATRPTLVIYSIKVDVDSGEDGRVELRSDTNATPTTVRATVENKLTVGGVLGVTGSGHVTSVLTYIVPAGHNVRIATTTVAGTPIYTIVSQTEQQL